MDDFLKNFDENKKSEIDQLYSTRKSIVKHLELISKVNHSLRFNEVGVQNLWKVKISFISVLLNTKMSFY